MADVVLCAPVVARDASERDRTLAAHYAHLLVHGALHAQGFDHDTEHKARTMERRETRILLSLGFADPWSTAG
jgi:probable rRNA maturation factor